MEQRGGLEAIQALEQRTDEELEAGLIAFAAPVFRYDGTVVAASATEGLLEYQPEAPRAADSSVGVSALVPASATGSQKPKQ